MFKAGFIGKTTKFASHLRGVHLLEIFHHNPEGVGFMGRGMLLNVVKKSNAEIVSIHDISDKNINEFMDSLSSAEQAKVRVCGSPADVGSSLYNALLDCKIIDCYLFISSYYHVSLSMYLSIHPSIYFVPFEYYYYYLSVYLFMYLFIYLSTYLSIYLSICLSVYIPIYL